MTEAFVFIEGTKHRYPMMPYEAEEFGWHLGTSYNSPVSLADEKFFKVKTWCKETFDSHTYAMFLRNVWFLREEDAIVCRLKWS